jgi:hypothetical protein
MGDVTLPGQGTYVDEFGVQWGFKKLVGWWDDTATTGKVTQNAYEDGGWADEAFEEARSLVVEGIAHGDPLTIPAAIDRLKAAIPARLFEPLVVEEAGKVRHVLARKDGKPTIVWDGWKTLTFSIQLIASDTRLLAGDGSTAYAHSVSVGLPFSSGGVQIGNGTSLQAPFQITATVVSGSVTITNEGNTTPPTLITLTGPLPNPVIRTTDGQLMQFNITLDSGQALAVDLDAKTVKLNGVNRRNALVGAWIVPEAGTVLTFDADSYNPDALMTVQWSDAWR